jgi:hypothetical protein
MISYVRDAEVAAVLVVAVAVAADVCCLLQQRLR